MDTSRRVAISAPMFYRITVQGISWRTGLCYNVLENSIRRQLLGRSYGLPGKYKGRPGVTRAGLIAILLQFRHRCGRDDQFVLVAHRPANTAGEMHPVSRQDLAQLVNGVDAFEHFAGDKKAFVQPTRQGRVKIFEP